MALFYSVYRTTDSRYGVPATGPTTTQKFIRFGSPSHSYYAHSLPIFAAKLPSKTRICGSISLLASLLQRWHRLSLANTVQSPETCDMGRENSPFRKP